MAQTRPPTSIHAGKKAVVVGAGPAGCVAAMLLAQQGWQVDVFEKRSQELGSKQRSWTLALYPRGINAIHKAIPSGLELLQKRRYKGLMIGDPRGTRRCLRRKGALIDRTSLANAILEHLLNSYAASDQQQPTPAGANQAAAAPATTTTAAAKVTVHFNTALASCDFATRTALFKPVRPASASGGEEGATAAATLKATYDLLIGADGAHSAVRNQLEQAGLLTVKELSKSDGQYRSFHGLPALPSVEAWDPERAAGDPDEYQGHYFFALSNATPPPPEKVRLFVTVSMDTDGTYGGYVTGRTSYWEQLHTPEDYQEMLRNSAPALPQEWLQPMSQALMEAPTSDLPIMRVLSTFAPSTHSVGGVVLIGDARGTVTPSLGQGVNSAMEDAALLAGLLAKAWPGEKGIQAAINKFSRRRKPQIRALQELETLTNMLYMSTIPLLKPGLKPGDMPGYMARAWCLLWYRRVVRLQNALASFRKGLFQWLGGLLSRQGRQPSGAAPAAGPSFQGVEVMSRPYFSEIQADVGSYSVMLRKIWAIGGSALLMSGVMCAATMKAMAAAWVRAAPALLRI